MNGIIKSKEYTDKDKESVGSIGDYPSVEAVVAASSSIKALKSDIVEIENFTRYLTAMYEISCRHVKGKIRTHKKLVENASVSRFASEGFALTVGNLRNLYFGALVESAVNHDRDYVLSRIRKFDPVKQDSIEWISSLKLPKGSPAMAMFSTCVTNEGFRFPVEGMPSVPVSKSVVTQAMNDHWIFRVCPLGLGTVQMIVAASLYKGGTDGIS
jgi:hypothetical protein